MNWIEVHSTAGTGSTVFVNLATVIEIAPYNTGARLRTIGSAGDSTLNIYVRESVEDLERLLNGHRLTVVRAP